ncbi:MAG: hypothetical protein OZ921_02495 [Sorangiineae bacterium]|nr:hypothetical protein [Polyangiaceae bacterium]MEB2321355.1 hypothetical protein [Sorangiineae bacterium]
MPTLLVTRKMPRELAERVRASVGGQGDRRARRRSRLTALVRFALVVLLVAAVTQIVLVTRRARLELERVRATLLERVRSEAATLEPEVRRVRARVEPWLMRFEGAYEGDRISPELAHEGALDRALGRPSLYVRGALSRLSADAPESYPDAFVLCLVKPPGDRTEKSLRAMARAAATSRGLEPARGFARYGDALVVLPLLEPGFRARVSATGDLAALELLGQAFDHAPLASARRAARAEQLLIVVDEPGAGSAPSELDGERPHPVRVGLVDLTKNEVLLRLRRSVDPSWASPAARAQHARGMDGCMLALDVRAAVRDAR